ncbi:MAG: group 1 truncated hemoglobin [Acidimicrobiia bacterium]|nr:group 1 truncated hemoglobin [Acidimicrobiia bacterium]
MTTTLYERLGGRDAIAAVVAEMCARSLADDRINAKFVRTDPARLEAMLVDQVCAATGGPFTYTGRSMAEAHAGMSVTAAEFAAQVDALVASLAHFDVPQAEQDELITLLAPMRDDIVEVESQETGTALPASYQNAPPLS